MFKPIEKHQLIFINPGLTGLYTAWLTHRMGLDIACVFESSSRRVIREGYPASFPSDGTFFPESFELVADEAGLPVPEWEIVKIFKLNIEGMEVVLNSNDGPGGLQLVLADIFRVEKNTWLPWLQDQIRKAAESGEKTSTADLARFRQVENSLFDAISVLGLSNPDSIIHFFDVISSLISGLSSVQLDVNDLPMVICALLKGWHIPSTGSKKTVETIKNQLVDDGVRWVEVESVLEVRSGSGRTSIVRLDNGDDLAAGILVVPENDRYRDPAVVGEPNSIVWENWYGRAATHLENDTTAGIFQPSVSRPPLNDNFITWHISPEKGGIFTLSAPLEGRYLADHPSDRFKKIADNIHLNISKSQSWVFPDLSISPREPLGAGIDLSGTAQSVLYMDGPMWGDDIYRRLTKARELGKNIAGLL